MISVTLLSVTSSHGVLINTNISALNSRSQSIWPFVQSLLPPRSIIPPYDPYPLTKFYMLTISAYSTSEEQLSMTGSCSVPLFTTFLWPTISFYSSVDLGGSRQDTDCASCLLSPVELYETKIGFSLLRRSLHFHWELQWSSWSSRRSLKWSYLRGSPKDARSWYWHTHVEVHTVRFILHNRSLVSTKLRK